MRHRMIRTKITTTVFSGTCACGWAASEVSEDLLAAEFDDHLRVRGLIHEDEDGDEPS
jgi:hypothetical protein